MASLRPSLGYGCEVWNTNKYQDKALESVQLCAGKYMLGCSVTICDYSLSVNRSIFVNVWMMVGDRLTYVCLWKLMCVDLECTFK